MPKTHLRMPAPWILGGALSCRPGRRIRQTSPGLGVLGARLPDSGCDSACICVGRPERNDASPEPARKLARSRSHGLVGHGRRAVCAGLEKTASGSGRCESRGFPGLLKAVRSVNLVAKADAVPAASPIPSSFRSRSACSPGMVPTGAPAPGPVAGALGSGRTPGRDDASGMRDPAGNEFPRPAPTSSASGENTRRSGPHRTAAVPSRQGARRSCCRDRRD